jgi:hypothetical protein
MIRNVTIFGLSLLMCFTANTFAQSHFYVAQDWEDATVPDDADWNIETENPTYCMITTDTTTVHSGSRALKAELYNPDKLYKRAEVAHTYKAAIGEQYFYRFSMYMPTTGYPANNVDGTTFTIVTQWHAYPDFGLGETWRSPNLAFAMNEAGNMRINTRYSDLPVNDNSTSVVVNHLDAQGNDYFVIPKGQWITFEVSVRWDYTSNGYLDIWMDGTQIVNYSGPTSYNDAVGPYMKMGIYRTTWITERETIYYDNLQILKNGIIVFPLRDTYVRGGDYADDNYGTGTSMVVKDSTNTNYLRHGWFKFDFERFSNYTINNGHLYLNLMAPSTVSTPLIVHRASTNWSETALTFNTAATVPIWALQDDQTDCSQEVMDIPLPSMVNPTFTALGLRLTLGYNNALIQIPTRESSLITKQPMLFLDF